MRIRARGRAYIRYECSDSVNTVVGTAQEIAERGIFLVAERPFALGTRLYLRLTGNGGDTVEVKGSVVWVRQTRTRAGPSGMSVEFSNLDASQRETVAYLVEEALASP